jgi:DNA-binding NarL/FixJ family response regulator
MTRVLIVDDHQMFAQGLSGALGVVPDLDVVGVVGDGSEVGDAVAHHTPDVIVMDLEMPNVGGLDAIRALPAPIPVLVVTMHASDDQRAAAFEAGAVGFLSKSAPLKHLAAAIRAAASGVSLQWSTDAERDEILGRHARARLDPGAESLTQREIEILTLLGQGVSSTEELAERLFISQKTVKNHLASVFSKLSISDRTQAAVEAIRLGFAQPK